MKQTKICYSLLNYEKNTHRHYFHIYEFIEALAERVDLRLLVMDASDPPEFSNPSSVIDLSGQGIFARIKRNLAIVKARLDGYKVFYHHYTIAPARFSALVNRITGGKTYLWHCIVMEALDDIVKTNKVQRNMLKVTFKIVHHLVTGTPFMAEYYAQRYPIKLNSIKIIPNYINLNRFNSDTYTGSILKNQLGIHPDKKIILYLHEIEEGRASYLPGIVKSVLDRRDDTVFVIAGDGRYACRLKELLAEERSAQNVIFVGRVPNTEVPHYYAMADVYIMTSNFEAFSRVLLEAMAMKTPYVATDGGGNIRTYTPANHQAFILENNRIELFPDRIEQLLDDMEVRQRFIDEGSAHVKQYSLETILKTFLENVK